jgi:hypothetical protein
MKNVLELQKTPELKTLDDYRSVALKLSERSSIVPYVPLDILYPITAIEINREVESRKKKMRSHFAKGAESVREITIFVVTKPLQVPTAFGSLSVSPGYKKGDGNTRLDTWQEDSVNPARCHTVPDTVTVKFVEISTPEQYTLEYDSYDSKDATNTTNNEITGAIRAWNIDMRSKKGIRGTFGESLRYAYPGDHRDNVINKVKYFEKELPIVDQYLLELESKEMRQLTSTLTSAFLIALKTYSQPAIQRQQLMSMIKKVARLTKDNWQIERHPSNDDLNRLDGAQMIARETINVDQSSVLMRGTSRNDYDSNVNFYLYCIEKWMRGETMHCTKGLKPTFWSNHMRDSLDALNERDF